MISTQPSNAGSRKRRTVLAFVILSAVVVVLFWPTRPFLIRIEEPGSTPRGILLFVPNPLRDKAPEYYAQQLLSLFQEGRCLDAVKFGGGDVGGQNAERIETFCQSRGGRRVIAWDLIDRVDRNDTYHNATVQYRVRCDGDPETSIEFLSVTLRKQNNGWRITSWAYPPGA